MRIALLLVLALLCFFLVIRFKKASFAISVAIFILILVLSSGDIAKYIQEYMNGGIEKSIKIIKIEEIKPSNHRHNDYHIYDEQGDLYFCSVTIDWFFIDDINSKKITDNVLIRYLPSSKKITDIRYNNKSMITGTTRLEYAGISVIFVLIFFIGKALFNAIEEGKFIKYE